MIHPTAVIENGAELGVDVAIGPYSVIGPDARLGDRCVIGARASVFGHTTVGAETKIHSGAVVGDEPQDYSFDGLVSYTDIGDSCVIREYVTIHRGAGEGTRTVIGDGSMLMTFVHIGHNCKIGKQVAMANATTLAGHVEVEDNAFFSAYGLVHQFTRIGRRAMVGPRAIITQDVPPFCMFARTGISGPNTVGLKRAGLSPVVRKALRQAVKIYFFQGLNRQNALDRIATEVPSSPELDEFCEFIRITKRGIATASEGASD